MGQTAFIPTLMSLPRLLVAELMTFQAAALPFGAKIELQAVAARGR